MKFLNKIAMAAENIVYDSLDFRCENLDDIIDFTREVIEKANHLFFIGNGGSAAIAIHMTVDFMKNGGLKTISMYDPATLTCLGNDYGYEHVFSKQLEKIVGNGDVLVAISSSGNSKNVVNAIETAHDKGAIVVALTGFGAGNICRMKADHSIYVPSDEYGIVESVHNMILQEVVDRIMRS